MTEADRKRASLLRCVPPHERSEEDLAFLHRMRHGVAPSESASRDSIPRPWMSAWLSSFPCPIPISPSDSLAAAASTSNAAAARGQKRPRSPGPPRDSTLASPSPPFFSSLCRNDASSNAVTGRGSGLNVGMGMGASNPYRD